MVHTFTSLGAYIAVDVNSGAVHVLDKTAYDLLCLLSGPMEEICPDEVAAQLPSMPGQRLTAPGKNCLCFKSRGFCLLMTTISTRPLLR